MKTKLILFFILFLLISLFSSLNVKGNLSPVAVAGYVTFTDGTAVPDGTVVVVCNENTGVYANTTTSLGIGIYATVIMGDTGDIVNLSSTYGTQAGHNMTIVDIALVTNWANLTMGDVPPVARFTYAPAYPSIGEVVSFLDQSTDANGHIVSWRWSFGDGNKSSDEDTNHTYSRVGRYKVTLTVTDNDGLTDTAIKTLTVDIGGPSLPPLQPAKYRGFTVPEMYELLHVSDLADSDSKLTILFLDSGTYPRTYDNIDLNKITLMHHLVYASGIDTYGHGTFISYELAFIVQTKLPNAVLISYRIFDMNGKCSPTIFLEALDEVKKIHPDILSLSGGAKGSPGDIYSQKIEELREAGIIVISVAVGNSGPAQSTILSPACSPSAIAIAASDPQWSDNSLERKEIIMDLSDDTICSWSSRGPVKGVYPKPDIAAPGESIIGPWLNKVVVTSGTSLSTPLIAGGAAVVLANQKGLVDIVRILYFWNAGITANAFEESLRDGCYAKGNVNDWGAGIPVFTKVDNIFHWKLIFFILEPIIAAIFVITVLVIIWQGVRKVKNR